MDDETAQNELVGAADLLFTARGIRSVGIDDIRDASGVPLKQLYRLYSSKEVLAEEVLSRRESSALLALQEAAAAHADPRAALLAVFDVVAEWAREPGYRGCPFLNTFAEMASTSPALGEVARHQKRGLMEFLDDQVRALGGPPGLSAQLLVLLNGAMATSAVLGMPEVVDQAKAAAATLLEGVGNGSG